MFIIVVGLMVSCGDDDPMEMENEDEEVISRITLTFTPDNGEESVIAIWFDADGEGSGAPTIDDIELKEGITYSLELELSNTLGSTDVDITNEISAEAEEHMFFFEFTTDIFSDPSGNGNVDNRGDAINYNDQDAKGLPVGLLTNWTPASATASSGDFRILLKHQPGLKTAMSDVTVGGTDVDISFPINIQ
ncbi:MAG: hypothetical protein HKN68_14050 [Saprospiraceae bacterium]|nr:hypothetical protein [Saprospiraceae bacterium]